VDISSVSWQSATPLDVRPALAALVGHLLPRAVSDAVIGVPNLRFEAKVDHGLSPVDAVVGCLPPVSIDGEQVGVLVEKRLAELFGRVEDNCAKTDCARSVVGEPGRNSKVLPLDRGRVLERVGRHRLPEDVLGELGESRVHGIYCARCWVPGAGLGVREQAHVGRKSCNLTRSAGL
jgi:hypothetical protein